MQAAVLEAGGVAWVLARGGLQELDAQGAGALAQALQHDKCTASHELNYK